MVTCSAGNVMKRLFLRLLAALVAIWAVLTAALYGAMLQTPDAFGRIMAHVPLPCMLVLPFETLWTHARDGQVVAGAPAPDFALPTLDHASQMRLSSFRGSRPVVLVFGSYT
jgi:hypothetical protein